MNIQLTLAAAAAEESTLSLESIKEAMDGFDPSVLLPEMNSITDKVLPLCRIAVLIGPILLLILGAAYLLLAPREANYYFGYRTYYGMGSVDAWKFTQRVAGLFMAAAGGILLIVMAILAHGFGSMELMDMVWRTVRCLAWEAGIAVAVILAVNIIVMVNYDRKGDLRVRHQKKA